MSGVRTAIAAGVFLALLGTLSSAQAQEAPTITIQNESPEPILAKLQGPTTVYVQVPAGSSRVAQVRGGLVHRLLPYGAQRYSYTKVGPFEVVQTSTEVSVITIVLHTYSGNTSEQPSNEKEFEGQ